MCIPLTELNSNPIYQPPLEWFYEESPDVEGEYIIIDKPYIPLKTRKTLLHLELLKSDKILAIKHWGNHYRIGRAGITQDKKGLKGTNKSWGVVFCDNTHFRPIIEKRLIGSDYCGEFRNSHDWMPYKKYFKCRFNDCDMSVKALKKYLEMNNVKILSKYKKKDLINLYMKL
tara:strand:- start:648 stop:1163 length:516 start_codon:yes stop_codon:yes gene_type:complete